MAEDIKYIITVDEYGYMLKNELQLNLVFDLREWAAAYQIVMDNLDYHFESIIEEFPDSFYEDDWDYFQDYFRDEFIFEVEEWLLTDPVVVIVDIVIQGIFRNDINIALIAHSPESILDDGFLNMAAWQGVQRFLAEHELPRQISKRYNYDYV